MYSILEKIEDKELEKISNSLNGGGDGESIKNQFKLIQEKFSNYDVNFLWLICYPYENASTIKNYIDKTYKKFHQYLDSGFHKRICEKGKFNSRMWEMALCDMLSSSGKLIPKSADGADFILELNNKETIQIEAVCPDEANDLSLRSTRPTYTEEEPIFSMGGNIDDLERPILLRALKGFDLKSKLNKYEDKPLIIAINSCNAVGMISSDDYILRRMLFGLGNQTITRKSDNTYIPGLQYNPSLSKPGQNEFQVARFLDEKFCHVSGVIYTSQSPMGLIPTGYGWHNSGIFYVPNPNAKYKIDVKFPFFKKMICDTEIYEVIPAEKAFI